MLLAHAPDTIGLRFAFNPLFFPSLPFNPIELVEELQSLCGWAALFFSRPSRR
ncbi:hypothetical protein AGR1C_pTi0105 [Agrobacterium fabacearum TT111]|nr:hypothetical protein AGR1C_pTi0105 [Agrobacterium fabacearum TT111]